MDPYSRAPRKNTSHGNEVLPQDTTHLIQRPCTSEEVRSKIQQAIGPHEDLLTIVKRRWLQWYGHISRSSGLAKTTLQGTVKGGRRQGRQRKMWEDNIREWTGLEFGTSQRAVENSGNGEILIRNYLWCLNDPCGWGIHDDDCWYLLFSTYSKSDWFLVFKTFGRFFFIYSVLRWFLSKHILLTLDI